MPDLGGPWWLVIDVLAVVVLGAAIAYGVMSWRKPRSPAAEGVRDPATQWLYRKPDRPSKR